MNKQEVEKNTDEMESLELKISKFLRVGVLVAGLFMLSGWSIELYAQGEGDPFAPFRTYQEVPLGRQLAHIFEAHLYPVMLSYLGLFILISLPLIRVALTAVLFLKQKERILAAIAFFVLACLLFSFSQGIEL